MGLANFHHRSATAASQILRGFDLRGFENMLDESLIAVAFDDVGARSREGAITLELTVNLLARLYPRLALIALDTSEGVVRTRLERLARNINPAIDIVDAKTAAVTLVVGRTRLPKRWAPLYLGSDGWITRLSSTTPVGSCASRNPFGAAGAACFGAANAFRAVFAENLQHGLRDDEISLSLLDQDPRAKTPSNPVWRGADISVVHLVGIGAIGNAAVWTLARGSDVSGTLHAIDGEKIELSNLQRYALAAQKDVGFAKVAIAARSLKRTHIEVHQHPVKWVEYVHERDDWLLQNVAVAVDTPDDRIAIQSSLPRYVVNSWTQPGDLGISRHSFVDQNACLACLYLPDKSNRNEDEIIAEALGLAGDAAVRDVRRRLDTDAPTDRAFLEQIAAGLAVPSEILTPFEGQLLRSFYTQAICGGAIFQASGSRNAGPALVPMAFQSALAGVLLAVEIVAQGLSQPRPAETKTAIDLLRPLTPVLLQPRGKAPLGNCICQDDDYRDAWQAKYDLQPGHGFSLQARDPRIGRQPRE